MEQVQTPRVCGYPQMRKSVEGARGDAQGGWEVGREGRLPRQCGVWSWSWFPLGLQRSGAGGWVAAGYSPGDSPHHHSPPPQESFLTPAFPSPLCPEGSLPTALRLGHLPQSLGHRQQGTRANTSDSRRGPEVPPVTHREL